MQEALLVLVRDYKCKEFLHEILFRVAIMRKVHGQHRAGENCKINQVLYQWVLYRLNQIYVAWNIENKLFLITLNKLFSNLCVNQIQRVMQLKLFDVTRKISIMNIKSCNFEKQNCKAQHGLFIASFMYFLPPLINIRIIKI